MEFVLQTVAQKRAAGRQDQTQPSSPATRIWSGALLAIGLFALINCALWVRLGDDKVSHDLWNGAGSIDIAVDKFSQLKQKPHVVLLGSSLMMYPFWAVDKQADANIPDIFNHRESRALQAALDKRKAGNNYVYSFAIFGQMVSDAYIYVNEFLKGPKTPDYVVFGIAPRDFHDSDLPAPMATYSFKRLVDLNNFPSYVGMYLPSFQEKMDWLMGRICYFYGHRWRLQHDVNRSIGRAYDRFEIATNGSETKPADAAAGFMLAGREDVRWNSSLNEYKRRYRDIGGKDFELQFSFLERMLQLCQSRHIKVIVVNMPLSRDNRQLLPDGFYSNFSKRVDKVVTAYGDQYLDLGASAEFQHDDFWDTTHLNHFGGHKLLSHIAPLIQ
ncbi:MAG TPA: hypothetical protein V6D22_05715 [Candidatus Obscuribacterales bacterium]